MKAKDIAAGLARAAVTVCLAAWFGLGFMALGDKETVVAVWDGLAAGDAWMALATAFSALGALAVEPWVSCSM